MNLKMNLKLSDFDFIDCSMTRDCMANGCWAMDQTNLWEWLKDYIVDNSCGFMFAPEPEINIINTINTKMEHIDAPIQIAHSGASFGITMRNLDFIAKNSFDAYKDLYIENKQIQKQT